MIVRRLLFTLVFLLTLIFQQSCKNPVPPSTRTPSEIAKEPDAKEEKPTRAESDKAGKLPSKDALPESIGGAPEKEIASAKIDYDTRLLARASVPADHSGWLYRKDRQGRVIGFEFSNRGGNRILPPRYDIAKNLLYTRDFQFRFDDRARQDIHLFVSDWAPSRDKQFRLSEIMNSILLFFPRNNLPAIAVSGQRYIVTLPTGEQVEFNAKTLEVQGGVLAEIPVDLSPDRKARSFPGISYLGKGVSVRADARGVDPRIANTATITIGTPPGDCQGPACNQCQVPSKDLWHQSGPVRFKFATDGELDPYLLSHCGFTIPTTGAALSGLPPR